MDVIIYLQALILGVVEGLTEFLPISSTGHLIVVGEWLNFKGEMANSFEVVIQLGAILAVCWEYRTKLTKVIFNINKDRNAKKLAYNLILGFLPAALIGFFFIKDIKAYLFNPLVVGWALIIGGVIIWWVERKPQPVRVNTVEDIQPMDALKIGFAQCLALIPGASRSAATIMGGILFGLERKVATEFSFFLAMPVIFAATVYDLYKNWSILTWNDLPVFAIGLVAAFISAFITVKGLLRFISTHTFMPFAWYRIGLGVGILIWVM